MSRKNPIYNSEGYYDPTAYYAIESAMEDHVRVYRLVQEIKSLADEAGFEVVGRITFKDKDTEKYFS